jgi:hypothetical protein
MAHKTQHALFLAVLLALVSTAHAFYDPTTGRWLNRDPLGEEAFLQKELRGTSFEEQERLQSESFKHPYRFVDNVPLNKLDPFGLAVVGVYGFGPADTLLWMPTSNRHITAIANATGGRAFGRSQIESIRSYIRSEYKKDPKEPIVLFGYSRGAITINEVADWILTSGKKDMPCAKVYLVGIDPVTVTGPGPVRVNKDVKEWVTWFQKNGGGWGPFKVATLNFENLDGTGFTGGFGSNNNLTGYRIHFTDGTSRLVNHADMPGFVRDAAINAVNTFKSRK